MFGSNEQDIAKWMNTSITEINNKPMIMSSSKKYISIYHDGCLYNFYLLCKGIVLNMGGFVIGSSYIAAWQETWMA
jgi:hypothetical protein